VAWHPEPRRMQVDGADVVVLSLESYERLDRIRRQAGALASRTHALAQQLDAATAKLQTIRQAAAEAGCVVLGQSAAGCAGARLLKLCDRDAANGLA
jgi:hypothetical protein